MRESRERQNKTQADIAGELEITQPQVTKWETGVAIPKPEDWTRVAAAYHIPLRTFIAAAIASAEHIAKKRAS